MPLNVAIIGAGLGGMTAALALQKAGLAVTVYEQAPQLGEVGAGITLSGGALRGLASLGLGEALLRESLPTPDVAFAHYSTATLRAGSFDRGTPPDLGLNSTRQMHRADLHAMLVAAVRANDAGAIRTGKSVVDASVDADGAPRVVFADGDSAAADVLIGADGTRSAVRRALIGDPEPRFAGQVAFRCLIPAAVAAPHMSLGRAVNYVGPGRAFHRYTIRHGTIVNVAALAQTDRWQGEGWNTPATIAEFAEEYAGFHPDVQALIRLSPPTTLIKWALFERDPLTTWHRGRMTLLGDAAHPILPFLGLGAALAIEDGVVIGRAFAHASSPEEALRIFEASRFDRVDEVRRASILQGRIIQSTDPDREDITTAPSQNRALYDYDPVVAPLAA